MGIVSGKITDSSNQGVPFVVVFQSDKSGKPVSNAKNTTSDDNGNYTISGVSDSDYLTFRMIGTNPEIVLVSTGKGDSNKRTLDVKLGASAETTLPEAVIVGEKTKKNYRNLIFLGLGILALVGIFYAVKRMNKGGKNN